jgi:hypothetical protein
MRSTNNLLCSLAVTLPLLAGCQRDGRVSGTVTYDGAPVAHGYITFHPVDDVTPPVGAEIVDGRYEVAQLPPGPRRVQITSKPALTSATDPRTGKQRLSRQCGASTVPANATGNLQMAQIEGGEQVCDFHLHRLGR